MPGTKNTFFISARTFKNLFSPKKTLIFLAVQLFFLLLFTVLFSQSYGIPRMLLPDLEMISMMPFYLWLYLVASGFTFLLFLSFSASGIIESEIERGTALLVLSRPVSRRSFILGKYLGVLSYFMALNFVVILFGSCIAMLLMATSSEFIINMILLAVMFYIVSVIVSVWFIALSMLLSILLKKGKTVTFVLIALVLVIYLLPVMSPPDPTATDIPLTVVSFFHGAAANDLYYLGVIPAEMVAGTMNVFGKTFELIQMPIEGKPYCIQPIIEHSWLVSLMVSVLVAGICLIIAIRRFSKEDIL